MKIDQLKIKDIYYNIGKDIKNVHVKNHPSYIQIYEGQEIPYTWEELKNKCQNGDFSNLRIGDYKTIQLTNGEIVKMQIAGIDTYCKTLGSDGNLIRHHIDWISIDCLNDGWSWNSSGYVDSPSIDCPYSESDLKSHLNSSVYNMLPEDIKNVIIPKLTMLDTYTDPDHSYGMIGNKQADIGNLWVPHEYEVFGSVNFGANIYSQGQAVQYPLFANGTKHRVKGAGNGGNRCDWWLITTFSNSEACVVASGGDIWHKGVATVTNFPLCFRI